MEVFKHENVPRHKPRDSSVPKEIISPVTSVSATPLSVLPEHANNSQDKFSEAGTPLIKSESRPLDDESMEEEEADSDREGGTLTPGPDPVKCSQEVYKSKNAM